MDLSHDVYVVVEGALILAGLLGFAAWLRRAGRTARKHVRRAFATIARRSMRFGLSVGVGFAMFLVLAMLASGVQSDDRSPSQGLLVVGILAITFAIAGGLLGLVLGPLMALIHWRTTGCFRTTSRLFPCPRCRDRSAAPFLVCSTCNALQCARCASDLLCRGCLATATQGPVGP